MLLSQVTITVENGGQRRQVWFFFESDHEDLADLHDALVADGSVFGQRLESEPDGRGGRRITSRFDFVLSGDVVATICPPTYAITEGARQ